MTTYQYEVTSSSVTLPEAGAAVTYGIAIVDNEGRHIAEVADISPRRSEVIALCARMRTGDLAPEHLPDVVHDWLNEGIFPVQYG